MSQQELEAAPAGDGEDYPPLLNAAVPAIMLVSSVVYAWSLRDMTNPTMNLLLLRPLFAIIWVLLLVVIVRETIPAVRLHQAWSAMRTVGRPLQARFGPDRFGPGTEAGAGLVVAATFILSLVGAGHGAVVYLLSAFVYLAATGYVLGDREPVMLSIRAAACAVGLYLVMGVVLGVRL